MALIPKRATKWTDSRFHRYRERQALTYLDTGTLVEAQPCRETRCKTPPVAETSVHRQRPSFFKIFFETPATNEVGHGTKNIIAVHCEGSSGQAAIRKFREI